MMITHYALHYKNRVLQIFLVIALALFCFAFAKNIKTITDDISPLSSGNVEAMFYIENPETGTFTCIGDGLINCTHEIISNEISTLSAIVSTPDYSAILGKNNYIVWNTIINSDNTYQVFGTIKSDPVTTNSTIYLNTFQDMMATDIKSNCTVITKGYMNTYDGGAATYLVSKEAQGPIDNIFTVALNNGFYANLQLNNSGILNVALLGIENEDNISKILNTFFANNKYSFNILQFNSGAYYIEDVLYLPSIKIKGTGNTKLIVNDRYKSTETWCDNCIRTPSNGKRYNYSFDSIDFYFYTSKYHILAGKEATLLMLQSIDSCTINNCNFYAEPADTSFYSPVNLLWFKNTAACSNITITNCNFINNCANIPGLSNSSRRIGGCLWFNSNNLDTEINNVIIDNCSFSSTTSDELIAFWKGTFSNIHILNSNLTVSHYQNDNMLATNSGTYIDFHVEDSVFNCNSDAVIGHSIQALYGKSDFNFKNVTFNLSNGSQRPYHVTHYLHYISHQKSTAAGDTTYDIINCNYNFSNNTKYASAVGLYKVDGITVNISDTPIPENFVNGLSSVYQSPTFHINQE